MSEKNGNGVWDLFSLHFGISLKPHYFEKNFILFSICKIFVRSWTMHIICLILEEYFQFIGIQIQLINATASFLWPMSTEVVDGL